MAPHFLLTAIEQIEAETPEHQRILVLELRRELNQRWPIFHNVQSLDDYIRSAAKQVLHFPNATDSEIDEALGNEEKCIHALRESLDFRDTAKSVGPVVTLTE